MKKPQFKSNTGKVFAVGKSGMAGLEQRIRAHAEELRAGGATSAEVIPRTLKSGMTFRCSRCNTEFVYNGGDVNEFYNTIRSHGRQCAPCEILPINI